MCSMHRGDSRPLDPTQTPRHCLKPEVLRLNQGTIRGVTSAETSIPPAANDLRRRPTQRNPPATSTPAAPLKTMTAIARSCPGDDA